jgi:protein-S-isoprenylcysteine O-methyltransferase Ste14
VTRRDGGPGWATLLTRLLFIAAVALLTVRTAGYLATSANPVHLASALLIIGYLIWLMLEMPVTFRAPRRPAADSATLVAYACIRMLLVILAVLPASPWARLSPLMAPAVALFTSGIALRMTAIRALGPVYSHHVVRLNEHPLVTTGPYRFIRHPAYAGMLAANLGFVLFFFNVPCAVAWLRLLGALIWRIRVEERTLWSVPGYPEFAAGRARLLTGVW